MHLYNSVMWYNNYLVRISNDVYNHYLEGKKAMVNGAASFNQVASKQYKDLDSTDRERLQVIASTEIEKPMTASSVRKVAAKAFMKIKTEVTLHHYAFIANF